jgi:hypothetical protein
MERIIFFTAGPVMTPEETIALAAIEEAIAQQFSVVARNASESTAYGAGLETADYVAGEVPDVAPYNQLPVFDPDPE